MRAVKIEEYRGKRCKSSVAKPRSKIPISGRNATGGMLGEGRKDEEKPNPTFAQGGRIKNERN